MQTARFKFADGETDVLGVIEIDAPIGLGGPETLWKALFELRLQIVSAQFRVSGDRLLQTLHVCELDGAPLVQTRAEELRTGVGSALRSSELEWKGPRRATRPPLSCHT